MGVSEDRGFGGEDSGNLRPVGWVLVDRLLGFLDLEAQMMAIGPSVVWIKATDETAVCKKERKECVKIRRRVVGVRESEQLPEQLAGRWTE